MMEALHQRHCRSYAKGESSIDENMRDELIFEIPLWKIITHQGIEALIQEFRLLGFKEAFNFTSQIASLAEKQNHHPKIITEWGRVTVYWWSHEIKGLHLNDFIMAAKTDLAFKLLTKTRN